MSFSSKSLLATMIAAAALLGVTGAGAAHATGDLYGAIAAGASHAGSAVDYSSQPAADRAALAACARVSGTQCIIQTRIHNDCGAVIERDAQIYFFTLQAPVQPMYFSGNGPSRAAAERKARSLAGPDGGTGIMRITRPAFILDTLCTANAG
ncbi:DUF4189 domain-containing protein [Nocardia macrotermitis]|uniref:DUF4189 domain-containing protein n=1 Tax=Nocardia macrotermitis TaxID=2585198 RepID=A0A7K0CXA2_9NOCA|nr:DUF4189 domain-containing protein [Nocardia macrotermitis]MQY18139.1 hypothetical protein [Nocardia macrotermitis]